MISVNTTRVEPASDELFVACSKRTRLSSLELEELANWVNGRPHFSRPLPKNNLGLVQSCLGFRLHPPHAAPLSWHPGMALRRLRYSSDALTRVMDLRAGEVVLDGTLGMGHDALVLAANGALVIALEQRPEIIFFTLAGIWRFSKTLSRRIHGRVADHTDYLAAQLPNSVDHVYLDPMFPKQLAGPSSTWASLRALVPPDHRLDASTLANALRVARRRVVLKLAPQEQAPSFPGLPRAKLDGSRRLYFAIWDLEN